MAVAHRLASYLSEHHVEFETQKHSLTSTSTETAEAAHVPGDKVAKGVILANGEQYVMAVVPATHRIDEESLENLLQCELRVAEENELPDILEDCRLGAVPPVGMAYGLPTIVDEALMRQDDIYFESGDHESLVHVSGNDFRQLMAGNKGGTFSQRM